MKRSQFFISMNLKIKRNPFWMEEKGREKKNEAEKERGRGRETRTLHTFWNATATKWTKNGSSFWCKRAEKRIINAFSAGCFIHSSFQWTWNKNGNEQQNRTCRATNVHIYMHVWVCVFVRDIQVNQFNNCTKNTRRLVLRSICFFLCVVVFTHSTE